MAKMQKKDIIQGFNTILEKLDVPSNISSIMKYTIKNYQENSRNVTVEDLQEVTADLKDLTGKSFSQLLTALENNEEVTLLSDLIDEEEEDEEFLDEESEENEETSEPVKKAKESNKKLPDKKVENSEKKVLVPKADKAEAPKTEPKKEEVAKEAKKPEKKVMPTPEDSLSSFPEELDFPVLGGVLKLRNDIKNIEEFAKIYNETEADLVITTYWTKKLLKKYASSYDPLNINPNRPMEYPNDLDVIEVTHASNLVVTGISIYSNIPQTILPLDFELYDNNIRYANGCEFQVYEVVPYTE